MAKSTRDRSVDSEKLTLSKTTAEHRRPNETLSQKTALPRWSYKGRETDKIARACTWIVGHQISISATLLSQLFLTHLLLPTTRQYTQKFFRISYYNEKTSSFALGWDDIFFVFYWIIVFTGMRCAVMDYILSPLAGTLGIQKRKAKSRFAEQAWILIYYTSFWCTGMYIMYNSDFWLNLRALWRDWPVREMNGLSKWYYLVQFAFWLQQIVVVNIEERRKDHWQMFTHHIITCLLVFTSYGYHQTKVGTLILCLMDAVDVVFPLAKILKYLHYQMACDIAFGVFVVVWVITRHVSYMWVCWSIYAHIPQEIEYGCYRGSGPELQGPLPVPNDWDHLTQPFRDPVGLVCWNNNIKWVFLGMLLALQCVLLLWFTMIVKVVYKVLSGQSAEDTRSDDEESDEEEEVKDNMQNRIAVATEKVNVETENVSQPLIEKEVISTNADFTSRPTSRDRTSASTPGPRSSRRKGEGHSSGVNLLAHASSDRKELLGRIGCDKGVD